MRRRSRTWRRRALRSTLLLLSLLFLLLLSAAAAAAVAEAGGDHGVAFDVAFVLVAGTAISSHLLAAPAFTSLTAPELAGGAPLPLPLLEVAPQRQGGWCCDEKLKTLLFGGVVCCVKFRDFPPRQRWEA